MCFDLKRTKTTLLDNSVPLEDEEKGDHDPYDGRTRKTKQAFEGYLERISQLKAANMKTTSINRLQMPWRTYFNGVDCGVFLMRHMETYMGEDANNYRCGFAEENLDYKRNKLKTCAESTQPRSCYMTLTRVNHTLFPWCQIFKSYQLKKNNS
ncbi:putative papain-like cysteine peptidase superfamily [Helianthus debilis subsp. tardiflorus]